MYKTTEALDIIEPDIKAEALFNILRMIYDAQGRELTWKQYKRLIREVYANIGESDE